MQFDNIKSKFPIFKQKLKETFNIFGQRKLFTKTKRGN